MNDIATNMKKDKEDGIRFLNKKINPLSDREVLWLRNYFSEIFNKKNISYSDSISKASLIRILSQEPDYRKLLDSGLSDMALNLVPQNKFEWLEGSKRAQLFTIGILERKGLIVREHDVFNSDLMPRIYRAFDQVHGRNVQLDDKIRMLDNIYSLWKKVLKSDNYSKWLDSKDIKQLEFAQGYLVKKRWYLRTTGIDPLNYKEVREAVLASIDIIDCDIDESQLIKTRGHSDRKKIFIKDMKGVWSSRKYRDAGKTKKPYHLPLTKETKRRLEKMSDVRGLSETAMLDVLINRFYEMEYVDVDGKDLY
ncbi:hypothetical protein ACQKCW_07305 [Psychrobacter pacificensis]|uniref:hypothetical protein n=1 Tax=Psychrobacter pacificensis TaxID=112002 RepID=UPI003D045291